MARIKFLNRIIAFSLALTLGQLLAASSPSSGQQATGGGVGGSNGMAGTTGSSSGSEGMADSEAIYIRQLKQAQKKGLKSRDYIGSLIDLGMHYNRQNRFGDAQKTLVKALTIIDAGALKPTPGSVEEKAPTVVDHGSGTVSATINKPAAPYEETLEQLLPALVQADLESNHLKEGEVHVKRLIAMAQNNRIHRVPALMFAYNQYSQILQKLHRNKEAAHYKQEADKINSSIRGL